MAYKTVKKRASDSIIIEKSEFIAQVAPVSTSEEAAAFIESVRAEHRRAWHNCYAYTLREGGETRFSDDGEPQGTAGAPILDAIQKSGLKDVAVVVTRYFGGILLGKGGLTRAYSSAASGGLKAAGVREMRNVRDVELRFAYTFYERILRLLPESGARTNSQDFGEEVTLSLTLPEESCEAFTAAVTELSGGKAEIKTGETYEGEV